MKPLSNDRIHSHAGRSDLLRRTLAGILILLATIPGTLMLGVEGEDDARNEVESRVNGTKSSNEEFLPYYAMTFTSRHLKPNELFEIKLELNDRFNGDETTQFMSFGITNNTKAELANFTSNDMIQPRDWMMLWQAGMDEKTPQVLSFIENGMRLGVMRKENGSLNIFVNGVDEGQVLRYVPGPVYGAVELMSMGIQASIIDTSSTA